MIEDHHIFFQRKAMQCVAELGRVGVNSEFWLSHCPGNMHGNFIVLVPHIKLDETIRSDAPFGGSDGYVIP